MTEKYYKENDKNYTVHCKLTKEEYELFARYCRKNFRTQNLQIRKLIREAIGYDQ
ncbi:MAG: hypothetical protein IJ790_00750 [Lachnospiraceae bacterium]|nr:hypothetical protein [Lachnospiraceae bacterium]